ncbi:MAG: hypothetical protein ACRD3N_20135 [Terracidiphilus sp.]
MQVNITKRVDTPEGKRYCPVIVGPTGRIKPDWVLDNDRQERHPEGACYGAPFVLGNQKFDAKTAYNGVFADPAAFARRVYLLWPGVGTNEMAMIHRG